MASPTDGTGPGVGAGVVVDGKEEGTGAGEGEGDAVLLSPPKPVYPLVPTAVSAHWLMESSTQAGPVIQNSDLPGAAWFAL